MKPYFDTSVLIKSYVMEPRSEEAIENINQAGTGFPISHITTLEMTNALQLKVFRNEISQQAASRYLRAFESDIESGYMYYPSHDIGSIFLRAQKLSLDHSMEIPNLLSTRGIGPNGSFYSTTYYDPSEMKIVSINLGASGTVTESKLYWEKGVWMRNSTYTKPDGQKSDLHSTLRFSDNGNTLTILINGEVGQTVVEKQKNIWKRIK